LGAFDLGGELDPRLDGRYGMRFFTEACERLRALFFREQQERELDEEVRFHLEMETEANLRKGLDPAEARRQAAITFGGVERVKDEVRDARSLGFAEDLLRDLKYAARRLRRAPALSAAVITTIALGVGGTTAVFSLVNGIVLAPLSFPEPDRLVRVTNAVGGPAGETADLSDATVMLYQSQARAFDGVAAWRFDDGDLGALTADQTAVRVRGARVTANFFDVLGVRPMLGRAFLTGEDKPGMNNVVVLSHRIWQERFQGAPEALGRQIEVNNVSRTIVGVMPPGFAYPALEVELWLPLSIDPARTRPASLNLIGIARIKEGLSGEAAQLDLARVLASFPEEAVDGTSSGVWDEARIIPQVQSLRDSIIGPASKLLWFVFVAVLLVLLVTCTNVAGLLLVRADRAQVEIAARAALGSGIRGILTLMLSESLLLGTVGGATGVLLAVAGMGVIRSMGTALSLPRLEGVAVDASVLTFAVAVTLFCAFFVSILPVLRARTVPVAQVLRGAGSGPAGGNRAHRARDALVVAQIALAVVLVALSGLMARSLLRLYDVHPGFESDGVVTSRVLLPYTGYGTGEARMNFFDELVRETHALPGVRRVALTDKVPFTGDRHTMTIEVEGRSGLARADRAEHAVVHVNGPLFETLRIPVRSGRTFGTLDASRPVDEAIVSHSFAMRYWPGEDPLGKRVRPAGGRWFVIVGVVSDVRYDAIEEPARETVYLPILVAGSQSAAASVPPALSLVVHTDARTGETLSAIRRIVAGLNPTIPTYNEDVLSKIVYDASARTRALALLLATASVVTLLLCATGLYGLLAYIVSIRQREIGIRMALGARPADIRRMISVGGLRLAAAGIVTGAACALALSQLIRGLLYGVGPADPATLSATCATILVVALVASWIPACRAAAVEPVKCL
jgi:putative ABC transport system permease protein